MKGTLLERRKFMAKKLGVLLLFRTYRNKKGCLSPCKETQERKAVTGLTSVPS